jgi:hypothetical protein
MSWFSDMDEDESSSSVSGIVVLGLIALGSFFGIKGCVESDNATKEREVMKQEMRKNAKGIKYEPYTTLENQSHLALKQTVLENARIVGVTPSTIELSYGSDHKFSAFPYQKIDVNSGAVSTQNRILTLATQRVYSITPGLSYKVYYKEMKPGDVISEAALYNYFIGNISVEENIRTSNKPIYDRKLSEIEGIVDSMKLVK